MINSLSSVGCQYIPSGIHPFTFISYILKVCGIEGYDFQAVQSGIVYRNELLYSKIVSIIHLKIDQHINNSFYNRVPHPGTLQITLNDWFQGFVSQESQCFPEMKSREPLRFEGNKIHYSQRDQL